MDQNTELFLQWAHPLADDIGRAQQDLLITALSLHPPRREIASPIGALWSSLRAATARGVRLVFILPAPARSHPATAMNSQAADYLQKIGGVCHFAPPGRLLHAKTACIDRSIVWVGSGNWTAAAAAHNHEAYLRVESVALAARLRAAWFVAGFLGAD